ncbi:MAG: AAA family ATPase, partial [Planctomycetes bacterium]|nr:AAA family ATPase [Planctomycetota bacterium]
MLKSLELFGFKTFADRTRFDFPGGITCIVGPNGSGKSNVVDAIKWILGDQSPKSLRGKEMADVIFNGSASRKPSSFAEATMTLDNTSGWLSVEATEIQIGRRLWRTGESEYLINGQPARLRDIRDLLLGTGAAASAYNIIEQGRVDQILQASPAARRMVFEEAAGISRYKARKTEALRKLDRVAHNVERLTDIVDEVEAQLNATRSQAAKAAKYRELSEQVRRLWFGLAADEYRYLSAQLEEVERTVRQQKEQVDELSRQQKELEEELGGIEAEMAAQDESLRQVERQSSQCREKIASHRSTIRNQLLRRQELVGELDRLRRQRLAMAIRARRAAEQAEQARQQLADAEAEYESQRSHLESREDQLAKLRAKIQQQRDDLQEARQSEPELIQRIAECRNQLERLDEQLRLVREALGESDKRRADVEQKIRHAEQALAEQRSLVDASRDRLQEAENRLREQRRQYEESLAAQDRSQHKLADLRERRSATAARRSVLEDLEERQQGLGLGVKDILARAASSDHPPWCHILGSVADLVEVDLEEAAFVDVALGPRAQLLVMDDLAPLIRYLNENPATFAGRVGFIAVPDGAIESVGP